MARETRCGQCGMTGYADQKGNHCPNCKRGVMVEWERPTGAVEPLPEARKGISWSRSVFARTEGHHDGFEAASQRLYGRPRWEVKR